MVTDTQAANDIIVQTPRGLSLAGTRITLYDILDYVRAGWPSHRIAAWLNVSAEHLQAALDYVDAHRVEVERQYQEVLRQAEARRHYWEERNRRRQPQLDTQARAADQAEVRTRIRQRREKLGR